MCGVGTAAETTMSKGWHVKSWGNKLIRQRDEKAERPNGKRRFGEFK